MEGGVGMGERSGLGENGGGRRMREAEGLRKEKANLANVVL